MLVVGVLGVLSPQDVSSPNEWTEYMSKVVEGSLMVEAILVLLVNLDQ